MRSSSLLGATLFFAFHVVLAQGTAAAIGTGAVAGHVMCEDSHTPCRFASVTIETAPPLKDGVPGLAVGPQRSYSAATGLDGGFSMAAVAPGEYYITALQAGYISPYSLAVSEFGRDAALQSQATEIALTRILVVAAQTTSANLALSRGASLSGTVRYDDGGLAIEVPVHLFRRDAAGKWQRYTGTTGVGDLARLGFGPKTDDRGRFYAPGLPPGSYVVQATLPQSAMLLNAIVGKQELDVKTIQGGALQVFYGNAYRLKQAKPIELHEGEDRTGVDIDVPTSGMHTIQGVVTAKADGRGVGGGSVKLLDPEDKTMLRETGIQPDGGYAFDAVVNGSYLVQVDAKSEAAEGKASVRYEPLTAPAVVEGDVTNLNYSVGTAKR